MLCCGNTLTDLPISICLTSLTLWQSNDCPSASKATLMNMDKYVMWIHYERLHNHNKAKHNKTVCIFLGICCNCFGVYCPHWSRHALCLHTCSSSYNSWKPFAAMVIFLFLANIVPNTIDLNTSPPRAAYMRQGTGSALVEIMPYRLFAAKHYLN